MQTKLTAVSVYFNDEWHTAFVQLPVKAPEVTEDDLARFFPDFKRLARGQTYTVG